MVRPNVEFQSRSRCGRNPRWRRRLCLVSQNAPLKAATAGVVTGNEPRLVTTQPWRRRRVRPYIISYTQTNGTPPGAYYEASTEGENPAAGRQYYRTIQVDLSGENSKKIKDIIGEIFHNLAMRVKVRSTPEEGSSVAELVAELRQLDCLFFDDA